ncbi:MAG: hypothetical protein IJ829_00255, partial [Kiritimatiellae bacterium]|nr:hypothetical protein [Kiritimatiellia bacterium]
FSVKRGQVGAFRAAFVAACGRLAEAGGTAVDADVDAWVEPSDLTTELADWIARLEPFGEGNPEPRFGRREAVLGDVRPIGKNGSHLSLKVDGLRAVWWGHGDCADKIRAGATGR